MASPAARGESSGSAGEGRPPESPCHRSSSETIRLDNPRYSHFLQQADALRREGQLCDATIRVAARTFRAHRLVLAVASGSLARRLGPSPDPPAASSSGGVVTLDPSLTPRTFQQVLDFAYSRSLEVSARDLRPLLRAARLLDMQALREQCCTLLDGLGLDESDAGAGERGGARGVTEVRGQRLEVTDETDQEEEQEEQEEEEEEVQSSPRPPAEEESNSTTPPPLCDLGEGCSCSSSSSSSSFSSSSSPTPPPRKMLRLSAMPSMPSTLALCATLHDATDATVAHSGASGRVAPSPPCASLSMEETGSPSPSPSVWTSLSPTPWTSLSKEKTSSPSPWTTLSKEKTCSPSPWTTLSKEKTGSPSPWTSLSKERWQHAEAFRRMAESYSSLLSSESSQQFPFPLPARHMYPLLASPVPSQVHGSVLGYPSLLYPYAQHLLTSPEVEDIFKRSLLGRSVQSSTYRYPEHLNVRSDRVSAECPHCSAALLATPWMMHHTDSSNPDIRCRVCGRSPRLKEQQHSTLRQHRRACGADKTYQCQHCSKKFSLKHQLDTHLRTHTGEKPFECRLCGQRSRDYSAMIKHLRTHGGATPYRCTACSEFCSSLAAMQKHLKTHNVHDFPADWNITNTYLYTSYT